MTYGGGIAAGAAAPAVMTVGFLVWEDHWKGSAFALNLFKCCTASVGFAVLAATTRSFGGTGTGTGTGTGDDRSDSSSSSNSPFPPDLFTAENVGFLMLSSVIGILVGDWAWLKGLKILGARRVILLDSLKPFLAAGFGRLVLGENLRYAAIGGVVLTVLGVLVVSIEKTATAKTAEYAGDGDAAAVDTTEHAVRTVNKGQIPPDSTTAYTEVKEPTGELSFSPDIEEVPARKEPDGGPSNDENNSSPGDAGQEGSAVELEVVSGSDRSPTKSRRSGSKLRIKRERSRREMAYGYALSICNVVLDTYGSVLTKQYGAGMTVWEINLIRFGFAGLVMLVLALALHLRAACLTCWAGKKEEVVEAVEEVNVATETASANEDDSSAVAPARAWYSLPRQTRSNWLHVLGGVALVTFMTPSLSNYALFQIALALALTLSSLGPLYSLPLGWVVQRDAPTYRACVGAVLAVAGVVLLAWTGE